MNCLVNSEQSDFFFCESARGSGALLRDSGVLPYFRDNSQVYSIYRALV